MINTKQNSKVILLPVLLIVFFGSFGMSLPGPVVAPLFLESHYTFLPVQYTLAYRNILLGILLAVYPVGQFLGAPILGYLSDVFSQRKILLFSLIATTFCYFLAAFAVTTHNVILLILSRLITGLAEGNVVIARSIIGKTKNEKGKSFGLLNTCYTLGFIIGPIVGALLVSEKIISWFNVSTPFWFAMLLSFATLGLTFFLFPREKSVCNLPVLNYKNEINKIKEFFVYKNTIMLLCLSFFMFYCLNTFFQLLNMYLVDNWHANPMQIANCRIVVTVSLFLAQIIIWRVLKDDKAVTSILSSIFIFSVLLLGLLNVKNFNYLFFILPAFGVANAFASTSFMTLLSNTVPANVQGSVFGVSQSIRVLADAVICAFGGGLAAIMPSLPFVVGALCGFVICLWLFFNSTCLMVNYESN